MISRYAPVVAGLALSALLAFLVIGKVTKDDSYTVYAKFADAGGILKNYNVKVGSVAAGKITDIALDAQDNAVVKMELDKGAYPIGQQSPSAIMLCFPNRSR